MDKVCYCKVNPKGKTKSYYYIAEDNIKVGDFVKIPFGCDNRISKGRVEEVQFYKTDCTPYPIEKTKKIIKKILREEYEQEDAEEWFINGKISDKPKSWEQIVEDWAEECKKAKSNLEMPLLGRIETPLCKICKNSDYHYGRWYDPECIVTNSVIPDDIRFCRIYKCENFDFNENSSFVNMYSKKELEEIIKNNLSEK